MPHSRPNCFSVCRSLASTALLLALAASPVLAEVSEMRLTPIVRAVKNASPAVVNIQGQKTVANTAPGGDASRQVNGMGTGVVIDPRGYILTNHHVVDGVRQINVALDDRRTYTAQVVAHDRRTDLAVIKVRAGRTLPTITLGTSSDLMTGEPVIAVGNAFGYEHTVTRGIISALHRDVQVSDTQSYEDLIQTDASINPGNSGGPLLSIEGKMVGLNVAVRAGAQGIGFAIPVDMAMQIAAEIMSVERLQNQWHGLQTTSTAGDGQVVVRRVVNGSPAAAAGLQPGDVITQFGDKSTHWPLDLELALLGKSTGSRVPVAVRRGGDQIDMTLALTQRGRRVSMARTASVTKATRPQASAPDDDISDRDEAWQILGIAMQEEPTDTFAQRESRYRGGMRVTEVRPGGPAAEQGIREGDILVGMHRWETASEQDIRYIVTRSNIDELGSVKFYLLRGEETLFGHLTVAKRSSSSSRR